MNQAVSFCGVKSRGTIVRVRIDYEITLDDFLAGQRLALRRNPDHKLRRMRWAPVFFGTLILLAFVYVIITNPPKSFDIRLLMGPLLGIFLVSSPLLANRQRRKLYSQTPSLHGPKSAELNETGIVFTGQSFRSEILWQYFHGYVEDERTLVMFSSPQIFHILPKRYFDAHQLNAFSGALQEHVKRL